MSDWQPISTAPKNCAVWAFNGEQQRMRWIEGEGYALWIHDEELLNEYGSPLYVYDQATLLATIQRITQAVPYDRKQFHFASVTNGTSDELIEAACMTLEDDIPNFDAQGETPPTE